MFFKAKQAPSNTPREPAESGGAETEGSGKQPVGDDTQVSNVQAKRLADDEPNTTPSKRQAIETSANTPGASRDSKDPAPAKTPVKQEKAEQPKPPTTPLMDVNALIRMKISSGSYALHENIGKSWFRALQAEFDKPYFKKLSEFVRQERQTKTVYPPEDKVYTWTHYHEIRDTRVVIIGQDPYHGPDQAHGLSFSVPKWVRIPPSLVNIFREVESDIPNFKSHGMGDLKGWSKQGVLLLNTCLTVRRGEAFSHQGKGWETFTDAVIAWISKNVPHKVVFMLWGRPAQKKANLIDKRHKILTAAHPSPLSAHNGFFGCRHFSQANKFLREQKLQPIKWEEPNGI